MAELVILGSGSGFATRQRFSTSIALLTGRSLYLLDCGEPCAALLFRSGIDALALKAMFISHMHPDHVAGLGPVLSSASLAGRSTVRKFRPWSINRHDPWYRQALSFPPIEPGVHVSETRSDITVLLPGEGVAPMRTYLAACYMAPSILSFDLHLGALCEGLTYDDGVVRVHAARNTHLSANFAHEHLRDEYPQMTLESYSLAVEVEGRKFVFSGDITSLAELEPLLPGADILLTEMAHYDPQDIGPFVRNLPLKRVILTHIHPGLEERLPDLVHQWADPRIQIAHDGLRLSLD